MGERTRLGLGVLGVALVLGGLGDLLLRATPWGINVLLWVTALVGLAVLLARWGLVGTGGEGKWIAGFAAIFAINAMNSDALIASTNIDRMEDGKRFDAYYLTTLSADAVPVLVEALPEIGDRRMWNGYTVEQAVVDRWNSGQADWRTWNLGRSRARQLVRSHVEDQNLPASRMIRVDSYHQDRAFMLRADLVIHNMLWITRPQRGISGSTVTSS